MGFALTYLLENQDEFVYSLKNSPLRVFNRYYDAYLLFLIGRSDEEALTWFENNAIALDSLTGKDIAFGVFVTDSNKIFKNDGSDPFDRRANRNVGEGHLINRLKKSVKVDSLISNGETWWKDSTNKRIDITYATDEIARAFEVLDRLPNMLILDPLPFQHTEVVELTPQVCNNLIDIFRKSISNFRKQPRSYLLSNYVQEITEVEEEIDKKEQEISALNSEVEELKKKVTSEEHKFQQGIAPLRTIFNDITSAINKGAKKQLSVALFRNKSGKYSDKLKTPLFLNEDEITNIEVVFEHNIDLLRRVLRTSDALSTPILNGQDFEGWQDFVNLIINNHVLQIISIEEHTKSKVDFQYCKMIKDQLKPLEIQLKEEIQKSIPDLTIQIARYKEKFNAQTQNKLENLKAQLQNVERASAEKISAIENQKRVAKDKLDKLIMEYKVGVFPKLSSEIVEQLKMKKLDGYVSQTKNSFMSYLGGLFKPETVLKIAEFLLKKSATG